MPMKLNIESQYEERDVLEKGKERILIKSYTKAAVQNNRQ